MEKCVVTVPAAFMHVRDNLEKLGKVADDTDLLFLKGLLDSPVVNSLVKVSERSARRLRLCTLFSHYVTVCRAPRFSRRTNWINSDVQMI